MKLTQHIPGYVETDECKEVYFTTLEEMLTGQWPASYQQDKDFYRFSISGNNTLMAEYDNGDKWWVIGFITEGDPETLGLPKWVVKELPKPKPLGVPRLKTKMQTNAGSTWQDIVANRGSLSS